MAFGTKMQEVFSKLIKDIRDLGNSFDFFKEARALDLYLRQAGLSMKSPQFIAAIFDELEYPRSGWKPDKKDLAAFFKSLPARLAKEKITDDILIKHVPRDDWGLFRRDWASAAVANLKKEILKDQVVMLSENKADEVIISVFLGDIKDRLGIRDSEIKGYTYKYVASAVDDALDHDTLLAKIKARLPNTKIRMMDAPNSACLDDARYEFAFSNNISEGRAKFVIRSVLRELELL